MASLAKFMCKSDNSYNIKNTLESAKLQLSYIMQIALSYYDNKVITKY